MNTKTPNYGESLFAAPALTRLLITGACFSIAAMASAQTTPSDTGDTSDNGGDVIKLTAFTVSADDTGYFASNSVSATRTNTPIKDLPFSVSAFTPQFMSDINARDLFDVVRYAPGVTTGGREFTGGNAAYVIRGFTQGPEIDGFTSGAAGIYVDTANIERVEVVKGPASILYGAIAPGGTVNYITKRAKPGAFTNVTAEVGTYNYRRTTIDINRPIIKDKLLFRFNGAWENNYEYEVPSISKSWVIAPTVTWNIAKNVSLTVSDQIFQRRETPPALFLPNMVISTPSSMVNALDGTKGFPTPASALAGGKSGPDSLLNNPSGDPSKTVINDGNDLGFLLYYPALAKTFNYSAKSDSRITNTEYFNAELDAKLGDHWLARGNFNFNSQRDTQKVTGIGTVGIAPPGSMTFNSGTGKWTESGAGTAWGTPFAGNNPTTGTPWTLSQTQNFKEQQFAQQLLANPYSVQSLIGNQPAILPRRSRMVATWGHGITGQLDLAGQYNFSVVKLKPLVGVFYDKAYGFNRTNSTAGSAASPFFQGWDLNPSSPTAFTDGGNSVFNGSTLPLVPGSSSLTFTSDQAVYGIINASFFHDRLFTIAGLRYNRSQNQSIQEFGVLTAAAQQGLKKSDTTPQLGLGYKVVKDALLYASYSESYQIPGTAILRINNTPTAPAAPTKGEGIETGIKTDFFDGRLSSTLAVYRIEQRDLVLTTNNSSTGVTLATDVQGESAVSKGIEYEVTFSPTDNLQIYGSVAEDDVRATKVPFGQLVYLGSHPQGTAKTLANMWARYSFKRGPVAGLWVGGGFNYNGKSVADARNPYFFVPSYILWNSAVGYDWKWHKIGWSATVNWQNMFNKFYIPANQQVGLPSRVSLEVAAKF
jgi:iron complex outermembrane receptor protein